MQKRAQGATEYLIVLAIVIIIGLIVVGVMQGVPGTGSAAKKRTVVGYWESAQIGITAYAIDSSGVSLWVRNNNAFPVQVTNIKFDTTNVITADTNLEVGEIKKLTSTTITCTAGNAFTYDVQIDYTDMETSGEYEFKGSTKLEGVCAG